MFDLLAYSAWRLVVQYQYENKKLSCHRDRARFVSRSFKLVPFESLGAVSYSPSIVTRAVSLTVYEIFSVKV